MSQREKFIVGATKKGYEKKLAEEIFDDVITPFAGYGFNKSHATGYARLAYETAYLKARYPTEFMAALAFERRAANRPGDDRDRGMPGPWALAVLPPDINESLRHFTAIMDTIKPANQQTSKPRLGSIRFGLTAIKGVGESSVQQIIATREAGGPFSSLEDFARRLPRESAE